MFTVALWTCTNTIIILFYIRLYIIYYTVRNLKRFIKIHLVYSSLWHIYVEMNILKVIIVITCMHSGYFKRFDTVTFIVLTLTIISYLVWQINHIINHIISISIIYMFIIICSLFSALIAMLYFLCQYPIAVTGWIYFINIIIEWNFIIFNIHMLMSSS